MSSKISSHDLADDLKQTIANAGSKHQMTVVTLSAAGWSEDSLTQTVTVEGISADETAQSISVSPYGSVENIAAAAGIYCIAQGENSLTFACEEIPSENVRFVVDWVDVEYIAPPAKVTITLNDSGCSPWGEGLMHVEYNNTIYLAPTSIEVTVGDTIKLFAGGGMFQPASITINGMTAAQGATEADNVTYEYTVIKNATISGCVEVQGNWMDITEE